MDTIVLEQRVQQSLDTLGVAQKVQEKFWLYARLLKDHALNMYEHSLRVGLYAQGIGALEKSAREPERLLLLGGGLHDIGKVSYDKDLFTERNITMEEYNLLKGHARKGFELLRGELGLTAMIAGMHHLKYHATEWVETSEATDDEQPKGYGISLAEMPFTVHKTTRRKIVECAKIVSMCDFFDALITRTTCCMTLIEHIDRNDPVAATKAMSNVYYGIPNHEQAASRVSWLYENKIEKLCNYRDVSGKK